MKITGLRHSIACDCCLLQCSSKFADGARHSFAVACSANPWARAVLANPHEHLEGRKSRKMPKAKFRDDLLKTVTMHKEQRNKHTDIDFVVYVQDKGLKSITLHNSPHCNSGCDLPFSKNCAFFAVCVSVILSTADYGICKNHNVK